MMKNVTNILFRCTTVLLFMVQYACNGDSSTKDDFEQVVEKDFLTVYEKYNAVDSTLFLVFDQKLTDDEIRALKFLYAYMPLNDLADYPGNFFLNNARLAIAARDSFSWGKDISERVFSHFVLPHRVNNENIDTARVVFFNELYPRIQNLTIEQAALEVNHWCHEKVNYQPSDSRTISPLGAIKTAYARCGEESTFTVTALRSVAIPARQVYTPRWAHVDDNHAWVEVFVDGRWQYLGACEPEPKLNVGWFDAPVLRAMMVHTKVFGKYTGNENIVKRDDKYTVLNSLENYAPTKNVWVKVLDDTGEPVENAIVEFGLYNYAEFYPIKKQKIHKNELAHILTGLGDLRVFASDGEKRFTIKKISVADVDTLILTLDRRVGDAFIASFENVPPVEKVPAPQDSMGVAVNIKRLAQEDSIRNSFIGTFYSRKKSDSLAKALNLEPNELWPLMHESRGNYNEIEQYLKEAVGVNRAYALELLKVIAKKDLHDVSGNLLLHHLKNFKTYDGYEYSDELIKQYVLNPRIHLEGLNPYRAFLQKLFANVSKDDPEKAVIEILEWLNQTLIIDDNSNYYSMSISPIGIHKLKTSDSFSRKLFFVAALRSLGIPSRLEPATLDAQFYNQTWKKVSFEEENQTKQPETAKLNLKKSVEGYAVEPLYQIHFSIAKFIDGRFVTLQYDWEKPLSAFNQGLTLETGYYQLLTGNRLEDGSVLVNQHYFNLLAGEDLDLFVEINENRKTIEPIASGYALFSESTVSVVGWIEPNSEPGNHFFNDFESLKETFESLAVPFTFYGNSQVAVQRISNKAFRGCKVEEDKGFKLLKEFYSQTAMKPNIQLPVFVVINNKGEVFYHSSGYNIGTSEQILKVYKRVKEQ